MKKIILCGSALLLSLTFAKAQTPGFTTTDAYEDFANATVPYPDMTWSSTDFTLTRTVNNTMTLVPVVNVGGHGSGQFPTFTLDVTQMDLSAGADIEIDIENNTNDSLVMKIGLEDVNGIIAEWEASNPDLDAFPNTPWGITVVYPAGTDPHYPLKSNIGLYLAPGPTGSRGTFNLDLTTGHVGGATRTNGNWVNSDGCNFDGPFCGPPLDLLIDASKIVRIHFTPNYADDFYRMSMDKDPNGDFNAENDNGAPQYASYIKPLKTTDMITLHSFKIGSSVSPTTGITDAAISNSLKVYPNPAKEVLNVSFDATSGATVSLSDLAGHTVYSSSASAGTNNMTINTSSVPTGMYILNVATGNGVTARKVNIR